MPSPRLCFTSKLRSLHRRFRRGRTAVGWGETLRSLNASALLPLVFIVGIVCSPLGRAQPKHAKEYDVKALFILNFAEFAQWPPTAFASPTSPLRVATLGADPFHGALTAAFRHESVMHRAVEIVHATRVEEARDCQVVFVTGSERGNTEAIVAALRGRPILTIGDTPDFARRGGMIGFYLDGQKVRFEINRAAARASGLKLGSQLLRLARLVGEDSFKN